MNPVLSSRTQEGGVSDGTFMDSLLLSTCTTQAISPVPAAEPITNDEVFRAERL